MTRSRRTVLLLLLGTIMLTASNDSYLAARAAPPLAQGGSEGAEEEGSQTAWRHLRMQDVEVHLEIFEPIRARYLQIMYDVEGKGEAQSKGVVHLDIDRAIHSGPWDGPEELRFKPLREPGLRIVWQVQNGLYTGFDYILTDSHLSLKKRTLPASTGGLWLGAVADSQYTFMKAPLTAGTDSYPVVRVPLPNGAVNILTLPYVLAAMDLKAGDRFTLPGFSMISGKEGQGTHWLGAYDVTDIRRMSVKGRSVKVAEVLLYRFREDEEFSQAVVDNPEPGKTLVRLLISREPPYLLGRADLQVTADGGYTFRREYLGLVDWERQPLPMSDLLARELWHLDLEKGPMTLTPEAVPSVIVPLR